jgi:hypothetical protein
LRPREEDVPRLEEVFFLLPPDLRAAAFLAPPFRTPALPDFRVDVRDLPVFRDDDDFFAADFFLPDGFDELFPRDFAPPRPPVLADDSVPDVRPRD